MPAPTVPAAKTVLAVSYIINSVNVNINENSDTVINLANGIVNGWGSYPTGASTFDLAIKLEFGASLNITSDGYRFIEAIGVGMDAEWALWVASWNSSNNTHSYPPTKASVETAINLLVPFTGGGVTPLVDAVGTLFSDNFGQETG